MKLKEVTEADIEHARGIYFNKDMSWDDRMNLLVAYFDKSERTVRKWCSNEFKFKEKSEAEFPFKTFRLQDSRQAGS